jgi:ferritin
MEQRVLKTEGPKTTLTRAPSLSKGKNPLITEECIKYLNYRVQQEEQSGRIYLSMSMWLNNNGFLGSAKLWKKYSDEEMGHAEFAREYLLAMGVQPLTPKLEAPNQNFAGLPDIIEQSFEHEIEVTTQCKDLADHALGIKDHMLYQLALQYLKEQVEEHSKMQDLMDKLSAFGQDKIALRLLDDELGK